MPESTPNIIPIDYAIIISSNAERRFPSNIIQNDSLSSFELNEYLSFSQIIIYYLRIDFADKQKRAKVLYVQVFNIIPRMYVHRIYYT